jgi:apolipoprotein N-acyltransferase
MNLVPAFRTSRETGVAALAVQGRRRKPTKSPHPDRSNRYSAAPPGLRVYATALSSGLAFAVAWLVTETIASAALGWLSAVLLVVTARASRTYLPAYCCGLVVYAVGFYWIYETVARFGGYGPVISGSIFLLYVATGFFPGICLDS